MQSEKQHELPPPVQGPGIFEFAHLDPYRTLPLIFQNVQTNGPSDWANIRMPYFGDKPHLEHKTIFKNKDGY